jgi:hypothetical protein
MFIIIRNPWRAARPSSLQYIALAPASPLGSPVNSCCEFNRMQVHALFIGGIAESHKGS